MNNDKELRELSERALIAQTALQGNIEAAKSLQRVLRGLRQQLIDNPNLLEDIMGDSDA